MQDGTLFVSVMQFPHWHGINGYQIEETIFSMAEYSTFSASITGEVAVFEAKQKRAVEQQEIMFVVMRILYSY
jgi:hypothetical protein